MPGLNDELKFGSDKHTLILNALVARIKMSETEMTKYTTRWDADDRDFAFQIPEREVDSIRKSKRKGGAPQYTTIYVPYSYAMMMSAHTFLSTVFLSRTPIMQYSGRHGESEMNVMAVEALIDYQINVGMILPSLYVWLHDTLKYGIGITCDYWDQEISHVSEISEEPITLGGVPLEGKVRRVKTIKEIVGYEGNRTFNVRPHDYLPDPRVPLSQVQRGEFAGRKVPISWNTIVKRKINGQYFNIDEVAKRLKTPSASSTDQYASVVTDYDIPNQGIGIATDTKTSLVAQLPAIELVVELIPSEWQLGTSDYPEKWVFTVIDRKIVVEARPLGLLFDKFPFNVLDGEIEGYALMKRSMLDVSRPLNEVLSWLVNSHFFAVRKTLNGDWLYDPSKLVEQDILDSDGTGSRIRLRPTAYGEDVRAMVTVLGGGADVTGRHLQDSGFVSDLLQRVMGINDNLMGILDPGGRKTATEVRGAAASGINRQKTLSEYYSAIGFAPYAQRLLATTQQNYKGDKKFKIAGDQVGNPRTFIQVNPAAIAGQYDYVPVDGTMPIDRFAMVNMWTNLFGQIRQMPQVLQQYDVGKVFEWVAQLGGLKNIKQFRVQVVPNGQVMPGAMPIPIGGANGQPNAGATKPQRAIAGGGGGAPVVPLAAQVPGVGPAG